MGPDQYDLSPERRLRVLEGIRIAEHFRIGMQRREAGPQAVERMQATYPATSYMRPGHYGPPADWYEGLVHRPDGTVEFWRRGDREGVASAAPREAVAA